eukprot:scaffold106_cov380-Prasinococcus_capsulatus_cf.AAC.39
MRSAHAHTCAAAGIRRTRLRARARRRPSRVGAFGKDFFWACRRSVHVLKVPARRVCRHAPVTLGNTQR